MLSLANYRCILVACLFVPTLTFGQLTTFYDTWVSESFIAPSGYDEVVMPTDAAGSSVNIDASVDVNDVLPTHFGNNFGAWYGNGFLTDGVRIPTSKRANIKYMRYPGGSFGDRFFWDGNIPASTKSDPVISDLGMEDGAGFQVGVDEFLQIADSLNTEPVIIVNAGYARYGNSTDPVGTAAHYAADFVRYVNGTMGKNVTYWEVGNEQYGDWEAGHMVDNVQITGTEYGRIFNQFVDSMRAADPSIEIGAVIFPDDVSNNDWTRRVLEEVEDDADFLAVHEYFTFKQDKNQVTYTEMMDDVAIVASNKVQIEDMVEAYTSKSRDYFPLGFTEFNSRAGEREIAMANALFVGQVMCEYIKEGYGMGMMWDIQNGLDAHGGDHGMISRNDPDLPDFSPRPTFFLHHFLEDYLGETMVQSSSSLGDVKAYATRFADGELGIVIFNTAGSTRKIDLNLSGINPGDRFYWHEFYATDEASHKVFINGQTGAYTDGGPDNYWTIPPYSRLISDGSRFDLEPYSITFLSVESNSQDCEGIEGGSAFLDGCGICVEGTTGKFACLEYCDQGFEPGIANWDPRTLQSTTAVFTHETSDTHSGNGALKVESSDTHDWAVRITNQCGVPLIEGKSYRVTFWAKTLSGTGKLKSTQVTDDGTNISNVPVWSNAPTVWTEYSYVFTSDTSVAEARARLMFMEPDTYWVDDFSIEEVGEDCNLDLGGSAEFDSCDVCAGGNTGLLPEYDPQKCFVGSQSVSDNESWTLVPNPSEDRFELSVSSSDFKSWEIRSVLGRLLQDGEMKEFQYVGDVLPAGTFYLHLVGPLQSQIIKIIKN